jgi:hypothetical protein
MIDEDTKKFVNDKLTDFSNRLDENVVKPMHENFKIITTEISSIKARAVPSDFPQPEQLVAISSKIMDSPFVESLKFAVMMYDMVDSKRKPVEDVLKKVKESYGTFGKVLLNSLYSALGKSSRKKIATYCKKMIDKYDEGDDGA